MKIMYFAEEQTERQKCNTINFETIGKIFQQRQSPKMIIDIISHYKMLRQIHQMENIKTLMPLYVRAQATM